MHTEDGELLMEKYDRRAISSTKDILREKNNPLNNTAVLFGDPRFDLTESEERAVLDEFHRAQENSQPEMPSAGNGSRSRDLRGGPIERLAQTGDEVRSIQSLLRKSGWQVERYTEEQALEERTKAVHHPRLLHVATHGFCEPDQERKFQLF